MNQYRHLSAFPENREVLEALAARGIRAGVLSNGDPEMLAVAVRSAGLAELLDPVLSVHETRRYKTDPAAYALGTRALGLPAGEILFVSSNGWDAIGATWYGYTTLWVNRFGLPLERLDTAPTRIGSSLRDVLGLLRLPTFPFQGDLMNLTLPAGVQINAPILPGFETILSSEALALVARLHRAFEPRRQRTAGRACGARQAARRRRAARLPGRDEGDPRRRLEHRADAQGARMPPRRDHRPGRAPRWSSTRFNSGADSYMTDFEDSNSPDWDNQIQGQINLDRGDPRARSRSSRAARATGSTSKIATLQVRPRGWHLDEKHVHGRRPARLRRHLRLRAVHVPQREGAARARRGAVLLSAEDGVAPRGAAVERHLRR